MSIRTDLIEAKIAGKLQEAITEKLASCIKSYQDYRDFEDILVEEHEKNALDANAIRSLLVGSTMLGAGGILAGKYVTTRKIHGEVLQSLLNDPAFPDKKKVQDIYNMMSRFAPRVLSNSTFARSVVEQLYNSPIITPDMVQKIVQVEQGVAQTGSTIPTMQSIGDILKNVAGLYKV